MRKGYNHILITSFNCNKSARINLDMAARTVMFERINGLVNNKGRRIQTMQWADKWGDGIRRAERATQVLLQPESLWKHRAGTADVTGSKDKQNRSYVLHYFVVLMLSTWCRSPAACSRSHLRKMIRSVRMAGIMRFPKESRKRRWKGPLKMCRYTKMVTNASH